jgi:pyruvate/2-oxoglutarate dehydrogenase complex dihydrolipoamide acyltransferase (E2) component
MSQIAILLPDLGMQSEEIKFSTWLKQPGEPVNAGEDLYEVEADKATVVCEAPASGVLAELVVTGGDIQQGQLLAYLDTADDEVVE